MATLVRPGLLGRIGGIASGVVTYIININWSRTDIFFNDTTVYFNDNT